MGSMHGPVGIAQQFTRQDDQVSPLASDNLIGLLGAGDKTDRGSSNIRLAPDLFSEGHLVARGKWYPGCGYVSS